MVLATRRVLLSLGSGIVAGAILVAAFSPVESIGDIVESNNSFVLDMG